MDASRKSRDMVGRVGRGGMCKELDEGSQVDGERTSVEGLMYGAEERRNLGRPMRAL